MPSERILVVDDDVAFAHVMGQHLKQHGFVVESFTNGPAALEALQRGPSPAVLVTDLDMPEMSGLELLRAARAHDPYLEAIVVTAYGSLERAVAAMRAGGAYDFLTKPFETLRVLSLAVERAYAHRALVLERATLTERLNAILTHTGDALLSADADGILQVANPAAQRLLEKAELLGQVAATVLPRSLTHLITNWHAMGHGQALVVEVPGFALTRWLVSIAPLPQNGWVMVIRDVTLMERLDEVRFQWLAEAANRMQVPLAQAMSDMAELNVLIGDQNKRAASLLYRQTKTWDRVRAWADHAQVLMKIEAGMGLNPTEISLNSALTDIVRTTPDGLIRSKNLSIKLAVAPDLPPLRMDAELLHRAVQALVMWSANRCQPGGQIEVSAGLQDDQIQIAVQDDGPALAQLEAARLFERPALDGENGQGLELALVKAIAERMSGQVWVNGGALVMCLPLPQTQVIDG